MSDELEYGRVYTLSLGLDKGKAVYLGKNLARKLSYRHTIATEPNRERICVYRFSDEGFHFEDGFLVMTEFVQVTKKLKSVEEAYIKLMFEKGKKH